MSADHPYQTLPPRAFWSAAVAKKHMLDIDDLWSAKLPITKATKIATFGSCFAQHFSQALTARGFTWLNTEPAPATLATETAKTFNYGVFTARTGNIYTTSLLLQWTQWAVGKSTPPEIAWERSGRFYDPFRPAVEPDGFGSLAEMLQSRRSTIEAFRQAILKSDLFVFTLGLTESWMDTKLHVEYPMCPGTVAGEFSADRHVFVNQDYDMVRESLRKSIRLIREARAKGPKFLLTVSPVPLTATKSGNHVLVATMESKSVLRAVAGKVSSGDTKIDYFPSYEVINSPAYRGAFFEPNTRSVSPHGVDHVMKTFFQGISLQEFAVATVQASAAIRPGRKAKFDAKSAADVTCEEEMLAVFGEKL